MELRYRQSTRAIVLVGFPVLAVVVVGLLATGEGTVDVGVRTLGPIAAIPLVAFGAGTVVVLWDGAVRAWLVRDLPDLVVSDRGIELFGVRRRRSILWAEVTDIVAGKPIFGLETIVLSLRTGRPVHLPVAYRGHQPDAVRKTIAAAWKSVPPTA